MERSRQQNRISGMQQPPDADPRIMQLQANITALQAQIDALRKVKPPEHDAPAPAQQKQVAKKEKWEKGTTSGTSKIRHVKNLPAVPLTDYDEVIWDPPSLGGTGDGQVWTCAGTATSSGMGYWYPSQFFTTILGIPGT